MQSPRSPTAVTATGQNKERILKRPMKLSLVMPGFNLTRSPSSSPQAPSPAKSDVPPKSPRLMTTMPRPTLNRSLSSSSSQSSLNTPTTPTTPTNPEVPVSWAHAAGGLAKPLSKPASPVAEQTSPLKAKADIKKDTSVKGWVKGMTALEWRAHGLPDKPKGQPQFNMWKAKRRGPSRTGYVSSLFRQATLKNHN